LLWFAEVSAVVGAQAAIPAWRRSAPLKNSDNAPERAKSIGNNYKQVFIAQGS
jgi:hypothetical protein